jgi:hypothetical protein
MTADRGLSPWLRAIWAAALFAIAAAIAAGLARLDLPSALSFIGVAVAAMVAGLVLYLRLGAPSMLLAGLLAAGGAGGTLHFSTRLIELTGGEVARLASIAHAPGTRGTGKNKPPQPWSTMAVPLVPTGWTRQQPVPAWLVCHGTAGGEAGCARRLPAAIGSAVIPPQRERADLRAAVDDAIGRHRLVEASGAPMLVAMADIDGEIASLGLWTWGAPLGAFALWLAGWLGGLAWRRLGR